MSKLFLRELSSANCASSDRLVFCCHILMQVGWLYSFIVEWLVEVDLTPKFSELLSFSRLGLRTSRRVWFVVLLSCWAVKVAVRPVVVRWCFCPWALTSPLCLGFWCCTLAGMIAIVVVVVAATVVEVGVVTATDVRVVIETAELPERLVACSLVFSWCLLASTAHS